MLKIILDVLGCFWEYSDLALFTLSSFATKYVLIRTRTQRQDFERWIHCRLQKIAWFFMNLQSSGNLTQYLVYQEPLHDGRLGQN